MLVSTAELMETRGREGVIAFNVITLEHAQGILAGAERAEAPVILQLSENAIRYHGSPVPISAAVAALAQCSAHVSPFSSITSLRNPSRFEQPRWASAR